MLYTAVLNLTILLTWSLLAFILAGGLYLWLVKKPETKPTLAAQMGETEAEILKEIEVKEKK